MDTDLYQILTLILLLGLLLTLFGVLQSLGAIRRMLEGRTAPEPAPAATSPEPAAEAPSTGDEPHTWARPTDPEPRPEPAAAAEPVRTGWPAPQDAAASEPAPATSEPVGTSPASGTSTSGEGRVLYGDSGLATATPSEAALTPEAGEGDGGAASTTTPAEADTAAASSGAGAAEDPQEQPFERDGRWWFRRGDELLVYEEQTGQWVAASEPSTSGSVAAPAATGTPAETEPAGSTEGGVTTQQEAVGSFWKCPSCGAVNGSTATSCRMCFTARP